MQSTVADLICEAEYLAAWDAVKEMSGYECFLGEIGVASFFVEPVLYIVTVLAPLAENTSLNHTYSVMLSYCSRMSWNKVTLILGRSIEKRTWLLRLLSLLVQKNSKDTKGR